MDEPQTLLDGDLLRDVVGRYHVVRLLGRGGMGAVYEVEHVHTGLRLAMKVLPAHRRGKEAVDRFRREVRILSRIQSEHVVRVTDADVIPELDGAPFLVMELLDGVDLESATVDQPVDRRDVVEWLRQVARGLSKAHGAGIVHRDLKPENLFLTSREDGTPLVKILDFGMAKLASEDGSPLTQSGQFLGTPHYMAPEQVQSGGPEIDEKTDLWAIGLIAFRWLAGKTYWKPGKLAQLFAQILTEPLVPPSTRAPSLGAEFDSWFLRSCNRDAGGRFGSVNEQVDALAAALGVRPSSQRPSPGRADPGPMPFETAPTEFGTTQLVRRPARDERLPCAPGTSSFLIKGIAYRGVLRMISACVRGGLRALLRDVTDERIAAYLDQPFLAFSRYDILPLYPLTAALARRLGKPLEVVAEEQGRSQARYDVENVYRRTFELMTLEDPAPGFVRLATAYYDFGECTADLIKPGHAVIRRRGLPKYVLPWFTPMHAAYGGEVVRMKGPRSVESNPRPPLAAGTKHGLQVVDLDTHVRWR